MDRRGATRFAAWRPAPARAVLLAILALIACGAVLALTPIPPGRYLSSDPTKDDPALYTAIAERVAAGQNYYAAAAVEQRARGYPLRPFVTVRPPTLAYVVATLGMGGAGLLLKVLMVTTLVAFVKRIYATVDEPRRRIAAGLWAAFGMSILALPQMTVWHEVWAALLVALSLALRSDRHWVASVVIALAAVAIRELAAPYLCVMAFLAWRDGARAEAVAWMGALALFAGGLALHAMAVAAHVSPGDLASPGWASAEGWRFVLTATKSCTVLSGVPLGVVAVAVPLALLGWVAWGGPTGERGALFLIGFSCALALLARQNNAYWGFLLAPLLLVGLAFAPAALADLVRAAAPRRRAWAGPTAEARPIP